MNIVRANNKRVDPSQLRYFLCFMCGDGFSSKPEYERHLVGEHLSMNICYQVYKSEKGEGEKYRKLELSEGKKKKHKEFKRLSSAQSMASSDGPEKHSLDQALKASKPVTTSSVLSKQPSQGTATGGKPKKRPALSRQNSEQPAKKQKRIKSEDKPSSSAKVIANNGKDRPREIILDSHEKGKPCGLCTDVATTSLYQSVEAVIHMVDDHNCQIDAMRVKLFDALSLLADKNSPAGDSCPTCNEFFDNKTGYYRHLVVAHVSDVIRSFLPKYSETQSFNLETHLLSPTGIKTKVDVMGYLE